MDYKLKEKSDKFDEIDIFLDKYYKLNLEYTLKDIKNLLIDITKNNKKDR